MLPMLMFVLIQKEAVIGQITIRETCNHNRVYKPCLLVVYTNMYQTLMNPLHRLLNCEIKLPCYYNRV